MICPIKTAVARVMADERWRTLGDLAHATGKTEAHLTDALASMVGMKLIRRESIFGVPTYGLPQMPGNKESRLSVSAKRKADIMAYLLENGPTSRIDLAVSIGGGVKQTFSNAMQEMQARGLVVQVGQGPSTKWEAVA